MTFSLSRSTSAICPRPRRARARSLSTFLAVWKERRELAGLSEAQLKDIGVSRVDAVREAARPAWDLPSRRR